MANQAVVREFQANGSTVEQAFLRREINFLTNELVKLAPKDKYSTVRRLLTDARAGKIDREVFKEFVRRTDSYSLVEEIMNWESYQKK